MSDIDSAVSNANLRMSAAEPAPNLDRELDLELEPYRAKIDSIDRDLLSLLDLRLQQAQEIGRLKHQYGVPVYQPEREAKVIEKLASNRRGPLQALHIASIWLQIFRASRELQRSRRVAFLGPGGTYTEEAMLQHFGTVEHALACEAIDSVFSALAAGQADLAVVPIENSSEGTVIRTVDLLIDSAVCISGEVVLPVAHCLLTPSGALEGVRRILGHQQALAQCRQWLDRHAPGIPRESVASNALAARRAQAEPGCAAIAGAPAAARYGLRIAARAIQDQANNCTRFVILGGPPTLPTGHDRTSILIQLKHAVGSLARIFETLARCHVSVLWLESRPQRAGLWTYWFLLDLRGHRQDPNLAFALGELEAVVEALRIVGSYPCAAEVNFQAPEAAAATVPNPVPELHSCV